LGEILLQNVNKINLYPPFQRGTGKRIILKSKTLLSTMAPLFAKEGLGEILQPALYTSNTFNTSSP